MPATCPRELRFRFGLVNFVARDTLTQAQGGEWWYIRSTAASGSYELLNCFVTVRSILVAATTICSLLPM